MEIELSVTVNEYDEVIGAKPRHEMQSHDIGRVSALWLTNQHGHILMAQRQLTKKMDPGAWGPAAAGTVMAGEEYEEAMTREAAEEIGLTGIKLTASHKVLIPGKGHRFFTQWFTATTTLGLSGFVLQPEEVAQVIWISPAELQSEITSNPERFTPGLLNCPLLRAN